MALTSNPYAPSNARTVARADETTRVAYLRKVGVLTFVGIGIATASSIVSLAAILAVPALSYGYLPLIIMLGAYFYAHMGARAMVFADSSATKWFGFISGSAAEGIAMGYLLLSALAFSAAELGNPLLLLVQAIGLVGLTSVGMLGYLLTGPKELSYVKGFLTIAFLPMLAAMVLSFFFSSMLSGPFGLMLSVLFVGVSAAGLLYQMNLVIHEMRTDQHVPGAYMITMGLLVLLWNLIVLLMRLQGRD